jgi:hypothetical protein
MKIEEFIENEDGSATIKLDLTEDEKELLILNGIKHAFLASLKGLEGWVPPNDDGTEKDISDAFRN